jgi:hypothetical protein
VRNWKLFTTVTNRLNTWLCLAERMKKDEDDGFL